MSEPCKTCGSELFAGQRFCRACGNPTDPIEVAEAPTREMPPIGDAPTRRMPEMDDDWGARGAANTAPQLRPNTNPVGKPPGAYQTPNPYQTPPTVFQQPPASPVWQPPPYPLHPQPAQMASGGRSGSVWAVVLAIILAVLLGGIVGGRALVNRIRARKQQQIARVQQVGPANETSTTAASGVQTFTLNKGATVSVSTISGDISVETWDKPQAEVQIISGNNMSAVVKTSNNNDLLSLEAPKSSDMGFRVKLPADMGAITIHSVSGAVKIINVNGQLRIATVSGGLDLENISGVEKIETVSGNIQGTLGSLGKDRGLAIQTVSGEVDLKLSDKFNANLEAQTMSGDIDADEIEGVQVRKSIPGKHASGTIGAGGQSFKITTTSSDINLSK
jgi:hypothetical protein